MTQTIAADRSSLVDILNGAPWSIDEGFDTASHDRAQPVTDFNLSSLPQPPRGADAKRVRKSDPDYYSASELKKQQQRELLAYLRSIHYSAVDADVAAAGNDNHGYNLTIPNRAAALESMPVTSVYGPGGKGPGGTQAQQKPTADSLGLYHDRVAHAEHAYIKSRVTTGITLYPLLLARGIHTVSQLRRVSTVEIDHLRHTLCHNDNMGCALFAAFLYKIQQDAVDPSLDGLEIARPSAVGSGASVRVDAHHSAAVAVDRRPMDFSVRWQQRPIGADDSSGKAAMSLVCRHCAPSTYEQDVERGRLDKMAVLCPRPPYAKQAEAEQRAEMAQERERAAASRMFVPRPSPQSGAVFRPRLTTLQHSLAPVSVLPEETDEAHSKRTNIKLPRAVQDITGDDPFGAGGGSGDEQQYDPFRCRGATLFTLDEIALTTKLVSAVKEVLMNQHHRQLHQNPDMYREEPVVDATTIMNGPTMAAAFHYLGVQPSATAVFQGAVSRGRLNSMAPGSMRRGSMSAGSAAGFGRRSSSAGAGSFGRRGSMAGSSRPASPAGAPPRASSFVRAAAAAGASRGGGGRGRAARAAAAAAAAAAGAATGSLLDRRSSSRLGARSGSRYGSGMGSSTSGGEPGSSRRGVSIGDLATFIEQRLDAVRFLKSIFCRFSRSTPWIIFRHEIDEAIRSRVTGINLVLQLMDEVNADILPFERFCNEAGRGKLSIAFTQTFLCDAINTCAESASGLRGGARRSASNMRRTASTVSGVG